MPKILSEWQITNKLTDREVNRLMQSNFANLIIDNITHEFVSYDTRSGTNSPNYEPYYEIRNIVSVAFWRAITTYDPEKGKFATYASSICRRDVNIYLKSKYKQFEADELIDSIRPIEIEENILDNITLNSILARLKKFSRERLVAYYLENNNAGRTPDKKIKKTWKENGIKYLLRRYNVTSYKFHKNLDKALEEARSVAL